MCLLQTRVRVADLGHAGEASSYSYKHNRLYLPMPSDAGVLFRRSDTMRWEIVVLLNVQNLIYNLL